MKRARKALVAAALLVLLSLLVAACGDDGDDGGSANADTTQSTTAGGETDNKAAEWGVQYTGGRGGAADDSQPPVKLFYVNQQGGTLSFDKITDAANAAVDFVNTDLGGVDGRPLELVDCFVQAEEDGQRCGSQLVNDDDLRTAVLGTVTVGNQSFFSTVAGRKPVFLSAPATGPDLAAEPNVYSFNPGGAALIGGMATFLAQELRPQTVSLVVTDNAVGKFIGPLFEQIARAHGSRARFSSVYLAPEATAPQITSAVQASGAAQSDAIVPILVSGTCDAAARALQSLAIDRPVVASAGCFAPEVMPEDDTIRDGWYFGNWGYLPYIPDEPSGVNAYVQVMEAAGLGKGASDGQDRIFSTILTVVKLMNEVGPDNVDNETIAAAVDGFRGPAMMTPGEIECGVQRGTPALCTREVGIAQFKDGTWTSVADGANGKAIDPSQ